MNWKQVHFIRNCHEWMEVKKKKQKIPGDKSNENKITWEMIFIMRVLVHLKQNQCKCLCVQRVMHLCDFSCFLAGLEWIDLDWKVGQSVWLDWADMYRGNILQIVLKIIVNNEYNPLWWPCGWANVLDNCIYKVNFFCYFSQYKLRFTWDSLKKLKTYSQRSHQTLVFDLLDFNDPKKIMNILGKI